MTEPIFANGIIAKKPHERAPEFIKVNVAINIGDFLAWADQHSKNGWVNIQIKESKSGKFYAELDTYERKSNPQDGNSGQEERPAPRAKTQPPKEEETSIDYPQEDINPEDIPF